MPARDQDASVKAVIEVVTVAGHYPRTALTSAVRIRVVRGISRICRLSLKVSSKLPQKLSRKDPAVDFDLMLDQLHKQVFSIPTDCGDTSQINDEFTVLKVSSCFFASGRKFICPRCNKCALHNDSASARAVDKRDLQYAHLSLR